MVICLGLLMVACGKKEEVLTEPTEAPATEASAAQPEQTVDSVYLHIAAVNAQLEKSVNLEKNIKTKIETASTLKHQNSELKKELTKTKDSIQCLRKELIEVKSKMPKKKNFLQKVFNIGPDSVEVIKTDTVEYQNDLEHGRNK